MKTQPSEVSSLIREEDEEENRPTNAPGRTTGAHPPPATIASRATKACERWTPSWMKDAADEEMEDERDEELQGLSPSERSVVKRHRRWRNNLAFASAVALVLGLLMFGGSPFASHNSTPAADFERISCPGDLIPVRCMPQCAKMKVCKGTRREEIATCLPSSPSSTFHCVPGCACPVDRRLFTFGDNHQPKCVAECELESEVVKPEEVNPPASYDANVLDFTSCRHAPASEKSTLGQNSKLVLNDKIQIQYLRLTQAVTCHPTKESEDVFLLFVAIQPEPYPMHEFKVAFAVADDEDSTPASSSTTKPEPSRQWTVVPARSYASFVLRKADGYPPSVEGAWVFLVARLPIHLTTKRYVYEVGMEVPDAEALGEPKTKAFRRKFFSPPLVGSPAANRVMVIGDTSFAAATVTMHKLFTEARKFQPTLFLHAGDVTYATNYGACYGASFRTNSSQPCGWNCTGSTCEGANRVSRSITGIHNWAKLSDETMGGHVLWMSTQGNHDNDLPWYYIFRPQLSGLMPGVAESDVVEMFGISPDEWLRRSGSRATLSEAGGAPPPPAPLKAQEVEAIEYMKRPFFYSFDFGMVHIVSVGTEDNPNNAYERWDGGPLGPELTARFEHNYGVNSVQYKWLKRDLNRANANRKNVPWIVMMTHRPMYHTSSHHPMCGGGGDWFVCLFKDTYDELLHNNSVNLYISGHSHHYQRSHPTFRGKRMTGGEGVIHLVVGTGGYSLSGGWASTPEWLAVRQGANFGHGRFEVINATHLLWEYHIAKETEGGEGEDEKPFDRVWIENRWRA